MRKKKVIEQDLLEKLFTKSLFFLKFRARSEKEIRNYLSSYLQKHKITLTNQQEIIEEVVKRLKDLKFIDDYDFARLWVESRFLTRPKGERVLIFELRQKGIAQEIIDEVIENESQKYSSNDIIKKIINKADQRYCRLPKDKRKQKLINYALRKGFDFTQVKAIVDELVKKQ